MRGGPLIERGPALKAPWRSGVPGRSRPGKEIPCVRVCDYVPVLPVGKSAGLIASNALCADCRPRRSSRRAASSGRNAPGNGLPSRMRLASWTRDQAAAQEARDCAGVLGSRIVSVRMRWIRTACLRSREGPRLGNGLRGVVGVSCAVAVDTSGR